MSEDQVPQTESTQLTTPEFEPCPTCNKSVTTQKGPRNRHLKCCAERAAKAAALKKEPESMSEAEIAPVTMKVGKPRINSEVDRIIYEKALEAQAMYAKAPDAFAAENSVDEFTEIRRVYAPDTFDEFKREGMEVKLVKKAPYHAFFGLPDRMHADASKGYVPVFNENGELVRGPGDMPLYKLDARIFDARERAAQKESEDRISSVRQRQAKKNTAGIDDVEAIGEHDIKELQATRKRGSLEDLNNEGE